MTLPETSYRTIPLTHGQVAIVDASDYEVLSQWKWHAQWNETTKSQKEKQRFNLGYFASPEEAHAAYIDAAKRLFGEFARIA